jgi:glucokinase
LVDRSGEVLTHRSVLTDINGGSKGVLDQTLRIVKELRDLSDDIAGIGIGIAGQVDIDRGVVRYGPNLWWKDEPFRDLVAQATGLEVTMRNDVIMATYGEWSRGAGQGSRNLVCLFVGTGIGGGAVVNGVLLEGSSGCAGHFGHISVQLDGPLCTCGRPGCIEAYAGGWGVARTAIEALIKDPSSSPLLHDLSGGRPERIDGRLVAEAALRGDPFSLQVRDRMAVALSSGIANVINSLNPDRLVLGGSVLNGFPRLYELVEEGTRSLPLKAASRHLAVRRAELGSLAGVVGAATMALR